MAIGTLWGADICNRPDQVVGENGRGEIKGTGYENSGARPATTTPRPQAQPKHDPHDPKYAADNAKETAKAERFARQHYAKANKDKVHKQHGPHRGTMTAGMDAYARPQLPTDNYPKARPITHHRH